MIFFFVLFALPLVLCSISTASAQGCGSNYRSASSLYSSYLTSPNYPFNYSSSTTCQWTITAPTGYVIELTFITFDTEGSIYSSSGCSVLSDYLEVYNGGYVSFGQLLGKYCKDYLPPNVYSSGTALLLKFRSYFGKRKGFKIKFKAVLPKPDLTICSPFNTKDQNNAIKYIGSSGYIKSPLYGTKYPSNIQCTWVITVPEGKRVKLSFHDFKVDNPFSYCLYSSSSYDYLEVKDGRYFYSTSLKKLCGTTTPSPIYSTGRYMWIRFKSNSDNYIKTKTTGFYATFIAMSKAVWPTSSSVTTSTSSVTGIVVGIVIGVFVVISLVAICVCIAKRTRSPGHVNVPPPTTQSTAAATTQYPQQVGGGSVLPPQIGYSQAPHGSYPPPPQGSYQPQPAGSFPPPTGSYPPPPQGSYQPPPAGSFPLPAGSTSAPVGCPPQSSVPMNAYPSQTIPDVPPPPYPGTSPYPSQATAPAFPYPTPQGATANPNPPYPPPQSAEHQQYSPPVQDAKQPTAPPF